MDKPGKYFNTCPSSGYDLEKREIDPWWKKVEEEAMDLLKNNIEELKKKPGFIKHPLIPGTFTSPAFQEHQAELVNQFPVIRCNVCGEKLKSDERCAHQHPSYSLLPEFAQLMNEEEQKEILNKLNGTSNYSG